MIQRRRPLRDLLLLPLLLLVACAAGGGGEVEAAPAPGPGSGYAVSGTYLYVCVQDEAEIAIIDLETLEVVRTVELTALGYSERSQPHHIAVEPDGSYWYVSLIGEDRVVKFDREDQVVGELQMETPGMLSLDPGSNLLAVSRSMTAVNAPPRIALVDRTTMEPEELDVFFPQPHAMLVGPGGTYAYTASLGLNQLAAIELASERVELVDIEGPTHAVVQFAISPDGRWMAGSGEMSGQLLVFDLENPASPALVHSIEVGHMAFDPMFTPDGSQLWVPVKHTDDVAVIDTAEWEVVHRISGEGIDAPHAILFSHDGSRAFVSNNNKNPHAMHGPVEDDGGDGTVVVVDTATFEIETVLRLGRNVTGIGMQNGPTGAR